MRISAVLPCLLLALLPPVLPGAVEWTGAGDGGFVVAANWRDGAVPRNSISSVSGDVVRFPEAAVAGASPVLPADRSVNGLVFEGGRWEFGGGSAVLSVGSGGIRLAEGAEVALDCRVKVVATPEECPFLVRAGAELVLRGDVIGGGELFKAGEGALVAGAGFAPGHIRLAAGTLRLTGAAGAGEVPLTASGGAVLVPEGAVELGPLNAEGFGFTIDLRQAPGPVSLGFAASGALPWSGDAVVRVLGFDPAEDEIGFGGDAEGLGPAQLAQIRFGEGPAARAARMDAGGRVTPGEVVPPPFLSGGEALEIGSRRQLLLDDYLVDRFEGAAGRRFHQPTPGEMVLEFDRPWEGNTVGYVTVFRDEDRYRMYYRASGHEIVDGKTRSTHPPYTAYAESADGVEWVRPELGLHAFEGSRANNILLTRHGAVCFFRDANPDAPADQRYKALVRHKMEGLYAWASPDGIRWTPMAEEFVITDEEAGRVRFDSQNIAFWNPAEGAYRAYWRYYDDEGVRAVRTATSPDFLNWSEPREMEVPEADRSLHLYTSGVFPYPRAPHLLLGTPMRYTDRGWNPGLADLPDPEARELESSAILRAGTALTDTLLAWSRDGVDFSLSPDALLRPGPERPGSWMYGSHQVAWHPVITDTESEGPGPEISLYSIENYRVGAARLHRHTLRLDGFASVHAPREGGGFTTPVIRFAGGRLQVNFSTSAAGEVRVAILDAAGYSIPGFGLAECEGLYGDATDRTVVWKGGNDLSELAGQSVRLRFHLREADLFSLRFE